MTMTHAEAIGIGAVEKYVLGQLADEERESFEAHFFGCPQCAREVESAATFVDDVRQVLPGSSAEPGREPVPRPRRWLPTAAVAGLTLMSSVLVYEMTVVVPALRRQLASAHAIQDVPQQSLRMNRGPDDVIRLRPGQDRIALSLAFAQAYPFYRCRLLDSSGKEVLATGVVSGPPGGPLQSDLQILVTVTGRPSGEYQLAVDGQQKADGPVIGPEVAHYRFVLRREEE